ncbi:MAG: ABC transporter ATP-binding protein [Anaerolineaceae bacterium]
MGYAVELRNIVKKFPGVVANDDVSLFVEQGDIHGLIGENGAGKSTLMNILYGFSSPDSGLINLFGKETRISSPHSAIRQGIGMVHQHYMLMPNLTVLQNIILGRVPQKFLFIDERKAKEKINEIIGSFDLQIDVNARISQLSVGQKQRVEIIKSLYRNAKILILDEPTAVLTPSEIDKLMGILRELKKQGKTIIFITHKLREVLAVTDNLTVMRKGIVTGRLVTKETNTHELSRLMVGHEIDLNVPMDAYKPGEEILRVRNLCVYNQRNLKAVKDVSFSIRTNEIVGVAGVEGNGQTELIEALFGMTKAESGSIEFIGKKINKLPVRQRREAGMAHIPEDRLKMGLSKTCTIHDNLILNSYYRKPYCIAGVLDNNKLSAMTEKLCAEYQIKTPDPKFKLGTLSGGNMQKVVFAREVDVDPRLLIAAQPTRGIDIGAIEYIHHKIGELRDRGKAILLISAELDEIMSLSDRILVMYEGNIVAEFQRGEADQQTIGMYMMGARRQEMGTSS